MPLYRQLAFYGAKDHSPEAFIATLRGLRPDEAIVDWMAALQRPDLSAFPQFTDFWFTEKGWEEVGRSIVLLCEKRRRRLAVTEFVESAIQILWRDRSGYEVAARLRIG